MINNTTTKKIPCVSGNALLIILKFNQFHRNLYTAVSRARVPRLPHVTWGLTADPAPDIYTVQLWNYNKLICPEAALLSEDETLRDRDVL